MEYVFYIYLAILTVVLAFKGTVMRSKLLDGLLLGSLIALSVIVRQNPHSDMIVYISSMEISPQDLFANEYFIKNIVYWGTTSLLYHWGLSPSLIFYILDLASFILLLRARKLKHIPYYFIPLFYVSFIGIFGFQNIYRQYLATILLIYVYSIIRKRPLIGYFLFMFAVLIHTSSILLIGAIFIERRDGVINKYIYAIGLLLMMVLAPVVFSTDYMFNSGENYNTLYLFVVLLLTLFIIFSVRLGKSSWTEALSTLQVPLYFSGLGVLSYFSMGTSLFYERVVLLLLPFMILFVSQLIQLYKERRFFNLGLAIILIIPTFTFSATQAMLDNSLFLFDD